MTIKLDVQKRDAAMSAAAVRAQGLVPAVVYGPKQEPVTISIDAKTFQKVMDEAGESTIINLSGLDHEVEVLIKEVEFNPVQRGVLHADLYAIERGKEMTVTVPLEFEGEAPAEKFGSVTKVMQEIEVTCRPSKLPNHITVDVSVLVTEEDQIHVKDLPKLDGVTYEAEDDEVVAVISVAKDEPEEAGDIDMNAIETEEKGKAEEAE